MIRTLTTAGTTTIAASVLVAAVCLAPAAPADPAGDGAGDPPALVGEPGVETGVPEQVPQSPVARACEQFGVALDVAAINYEEFAYATAGNGDQVDYRDPTVQQTNVVGRTALREAAAAVLNASRTPGLPPEVSDAMRSWSADATRLIVTMGLRRGGNALNAAAIRLNGEADEVQAVCARSMSQP